MHVICVFVFVYLLSLLFLCVLFVSSFLYFSSHDDCIVYALMYVHIYSYLVDKLDIWSLYLSPSLKKIQKKYSHYINIVSF